MEKRALLSVSDKSGLVDFARALVDEFEYTLLSTGGTARALTEAGLTVTEVGEYTGFPEMMDGRLKTLHPKVHGGLLARRDVPAHLEAAQTHGIGLIDLVCVNLYPFEQTIARRDCTLPEAIEQIDIGGPSMLRSAAKNHAAVTVVIEPADYPRVLEALRGEESVLLNLRRQLAQKVFARTSAYDRAIADFLATREVPEEPGAILGLPPRVDLRLEKALDLRYGENPHQQAALYGTFLEHFEQLQGKQLSFNNIVDITAAAYLIGEFEKPTVAILKHTNPCGVASSMDGLKAAWDLAFETDKQAPFGGIIVVNRTLDLDLAEAIGDLFTEVIIAPGYTDEAAAFLARKKNLRLMRASATMRADSLQEIKSVIGGVLLQDRDQSPINPRNFQVVTERQPSAEEMQSLLFGWKVCRHVKSNAIVYASGERTLGIGAGQMSRVDSSRIAVWKAGEAGLDLKGSAIASEALFPFPDALEAAAQAGATAAIQPGGAKRDKDVIQAANDAGMAMIFTGRRHFKH
ncbi:MAG: bifunctional phosphoribosylaminoimidazolecarboxamide formyltransferase/IMP cyclohydrolase [Opitutales bacterium]